MPKVGLLVQVPEGDDERLTGAGDASSTERTIAYSRKIQKAALRWMKDMADQRRTFRTKGEIASQIGNAVVPRASQPTGNRWREQFTVEGACFQLNTVELEVGEGATEEFYTFTRRPWGMMTPAWRLEVRKLWKLGPDEWDENGNGGTAHV